VISRGNKDDDKARLQPDRKEARAVPAGPRTFFLAAGRRESAGNGRRGTGFAWSKQVRQRPYGPKIQQDKIQQD
jgi:hypothetical protein